MSSSLDARGPGSISIFFVYQAGVFAAGLWAWLAILAVTESPVSGWHAVAASGASTTTLVAVVLGVRLAAQRSAARRHHEIMRTLLDIDWNAFASAAASAAASLPAGELTIAHPRSGKEADVIPLEPDVRQRPHQ